MPAATTESSRNRTAAPNTRGLLAAEETQPDGSLVLLPSDPMSTTITLSPQQQQTEVRFRYKAKAIGVTGLRFVARVQTQTQAAAAASLESAKVDLQLPTADVKPFKTKIFGTEVTIGSPASVASSSAEEAATKQRSADRGLLASTATAQPADEGSDSGWVVADAVQGDVEVRGQQSSLFVATSFSLQALGDEAGSKGRQEGLALPDATPGSGTLDLLAGVGYLPAVKVRLVQVYENDFKQELFTLPRIMMLRKHAWGILQKHLAAVQLLQMS